MVGVAAVESPLFEELPYALMPLRITIADLFLWITTNVYPQIQVCRRDHVETHLTRVSLPYSLGDPLWQASKTAIHTLGTVTYNFTPLLGWLVAFILPFSPL